MERPHCTTVDPFKELLCSLHSSTVSEKLCFSISIAMEYFQKNYFFQWLLTLWSCKWTSTNTPQSLTVSLTITILSCKRGLNWYQIVSPKRSQLHEPLSSKMWSMQWYTFEVIPQVGSSYIENKIVWNTKKSKFKFQSGWRSSSTLKPREWPVIKIRGFSIKNCWLIANRILNW